MSGIDRLLSWFPASWKVRYGTEVRDLLQSQPVTWRVYRDLLFACVDAWTREGSASARRLWLTVWELTVVALVVACMASVGWVVAAGAHSAAVQLGFAGWLQSQAGPSVSETLARFRDVLWIATCWFVLGWGWKLTPRTPGAKTIVCVLVTFTALLALDLNGPGFVDAMCFGNFLCTPFTTRLQTFVAWATSLMASPPGPVLDVPGGSE